jgi:hypothetical protein
MISILTYIYFLMPKIDLINFSFSPTGIRIQDICILLMTVLLPTRFKTKIRDFSIIVIVLAAPSFLVGLSLVGFPQVLAGNLRLIEYLCLAVCLSYLFEKNRLPKILWNCLIIHILIGIFQYLLLIPLIDPGRGIYYTRTFSGMMGNPAELTYFFICILPIIQFKSNKKILSLKFIILLNQVIAGALSFIVNLKLKRLIALASFLFVIDYFTLSISQELVNFVRFMMQIELIDAPLRSGLGYENAEPYGGEASLAERAYKWMSAVGFLKHNLLAFVFGLGFGTWPGAMDGGLVRLLIELGVFYFFFILFLFLRAGFKIFIIFISTNLLFDGYVSSIVAPILLFYVISPNKAHFK